MTTSNRSKAPLLGIMALAALGFLAVCCIAGVLLFLPDSEPTTSEPQPMETSAPLDDPAEAPVDAPANEAPSAPADPLPAGDVYVHPTAGFSVQPYGDRTDEGENYITFYSEQDLIDITVFDLEGSLSEQSLTKLANEVLKGVLIDTGWASAYALTDDAAEEINQGYVVYFTFSADQVPGSQGALFLRQDGAQLVAITLLTEDVNQSLDGFAQVASSYQPAGGTQAEQPAAPAVEFEAGVITNGFRVEDDGFGFENYGNEPGMVSMTAAEMQRMFGDAVCASTKNNTCVLKPTAKSWMDEANDAMGGGHCEGMAVLSQLFFYNQMQPDTFGAPRTVDLSISNEDLQREIAYWWVTQSTRPGGTLKINDSPAAVVEALIENFRQGKDASEYWVVGIYMRDGSGGHAITPVGVEDLGGGKYDILVYDNNWPGDTRRINVDVNQNTWYYLASINPNEAEAVYEGDAGTMTLEIVAISPRLDQQACTFCSGRGATADAGGPRSLAKQKYYEIYLEGQTDLLITTEDGGQIGYLDGELVNTIENAQMDTFRFGIDVWDTNYEPVYKLPVGKSFAVSVLGNNLTEAATASVTIIGPGFYMSIANIYVEAGGQEDLGVANEGNFFGLVYLSEYTETPEIEMGVEFEDGTSYAFLVQATELTGELDTLNMGIDLDTGEFVLNSSDNESPGTYNVYVLRLDEDSIEAFGTEGLVLEPGSTVHLQYLAWTTSGDAMLVEVDVNEDGVIDETLELPDTSDEFYWE